jgi:hypothetical protein
MLTISETFYAISYGIKKIPELLEANSGIFLGGQRVGDHAALCRKQKSGE